MLAQRTKSFPVEILKCAQCGFYPLSKIAEGLECGNCQFRIPITDEKVFYISSQEEFIQDGLDRIKSLVKRFSRFYRILTAVISPVFPGASIRIHRYLSEHLRGKSKIALNLGSGPSDFGPEVFNVDIMNYSQVNLICGMECLPIRDQSVDCVINVAVLEHLSEPRMAIQEMHRILKPGGKLLCFVPFIQGFHASPYDFQRYTLEGMRYQFQKFQIQKIQGIGTTSGMLWIFQEWLAILLSLGINPLYRALHFGIMICTWPIKFLDLIVDRHPQSKNICSGFYIECIK